MAAEATLVHEALARTSSKRSSEESYKALKARLARHCTCSRTHRNRNQKVNELDSTVPTSDTDFSRKH